MSNAFLTENDQVLSSANGDFVVQNGQVTVRGQVPVPEPSTVALLAVGVAALAVRRWARRRLAARPSA